MRRKACFFFDSESQGNLIEEDFNKGLGERSLRSSWNDHKAVGVDEDENGV